MQVNMLEAKNALSRLVAAAERGYGLFAQNPVVGSSTLLPKSR